MRPAPSRLTRPGRTTRLQSVPRVPPALWACFACALFLMACGGPPAARQLPERECLRGLSEADIPARGWLLVDSKTGCPVSDETVQQELAAATYVYVGERHDQPDHHAFQAWVVEQVANTGVPTAVGFEMFQPRQQAELDRYSAGEITTTDFPKAVDWESSWGMDFGLYQPIIEQGQRDNVRLVGLNARRELSSETYQKGLDGLSPEQRAELPDVIDDSNDEYRAWVTRALLAHFPEDEQPATDDPEFLAMQQRFFEAQLVWDETMAANTVKARQNGAEAVVVVAGGGHIQYGWGIPDRVAREDPAAGLIFTCTVIDPDNDLQQAVDPRASRFTCITRNRPAKKDPPGQ